MALAALLTAVASLAFPWLAMLLGIGGLAALALARREPMPRDAVDAMNSA